MTNYMNSCLVIISGFLQKGKDAFHVFYLRIREHLKMDFEA